MEKQSISHLQHLFKSGMLTEKEIDLLRNDKRKGAQLLVKRFEKEKQKEEELERAFEEMCLYERKQYVMNNHYIAGVDEAGRGPLAGPVVAAAVILPSDFKLLGLNDSKQINETDREKFYDIVLSEATSYGISIINNDQIDTINIFEATKLAMTEAINKLDPYPDHILIDAVELKGLSCTHEAIIKGDAKSISIAAASILAKVTRDRLMKDMHLEYPMYDFAANMGYGTKKHLESLQKYGPSPYHRKTFAPVREVM
ncbi:ribonuclease HII [Ornithinibacillus halophilus]|uniref:Ribonuclease HII n=1 Tax=Ornithinibacillus halophilus TaxID=930117 RepID=A0A1M5C8U5_9BACI|nr:ribonuclease HII [Ornithinibacillus halophilus]SHF51141.1 RNase HII [Ornithinibacillus halophilus]